MESEAPTSPRKTAKLTKNHPFTILFFLHLAIVSVLVVALLIHGFLISPDRHRKFHPKKWFLPLFASILFAVISSLSWLLIIRFRPSAALKAVFWLSPLFTLGIGVVLVMAGSPADLGVGILAIISSVAFSIYGCWVIPHLRHGIRILKNCTDSSSPKSFILTAMAVFTSAAYSCVLIAGIGGARSGSITGFNGYKPISILIILMSMGWTMQVIKNALRVTFARIHHIKLLQDVESDVLLSFRMAVSESIGTICVGSLLVPLIGLVRGTARGMEIASGGSDEIMFSCNECYSGLASRLIRHGNRWGFVHVGVYGKGILQASRDIWELFERANVLELIDSDIANSMCFLSGVAGGSLSGLVAGVWAFVVHKGYSTEVSVYAFFIGYFMTRIAMAWPQASVLAYYVAYSENPDCIHFDGTIEVRLHELQRDQV
ncbi:hypothetical protein V2J09_018670 [Rumex salicifolius]